MRGRYCLITGATSGIGKEISMQLVELEAKVVLVGRDRSKGESVMEEIRHKTGQRPDGLLIADLSSQAEIRDLTQKYKSDFPGLHVLVNNAGTGMERRVLTVDGMETTFAVNYLSYFLLTNLLIDLLKSSAPSRVINTVSQIHRAVSLDFDNLQGEKYFNRDFSYAQSKLADILFTYELARRLEGTGVSVNCVCPGAVATGLWRTSSKFMDSIMKLFMKGPAEGARMPVHLASSAEMNGISCRYYQTNQHLKFSRVNLRNAQAKSSEETYDLETAGKLWDISTKLTGLQQTV